MLQERSNENGFHDEHDRFEYFFEVANSCASLGESTRNRCGKFPKNRDLHAKAMMQVHQLSIFPKCVFCPFKFLVAGVYKVLK